MARPPPQQQCFFTDTTFDPQQGVAMPQADVYWSPNWLASNQADAFFTSLREQTAWQQLPISMFGRTVMQPPPTPVSIPSCSISIEMVAITWAGIETMNWNWGGSRPLPL